MIKSVSDDAPTTDELTRRVYGAGRHVFVGIHGWNGSPRTFEPLADYRPDEARFISLQLPGYGRSAPPANWSLDAVASQIVTTIDREVDQGSVSLVGSCSGGVVGLFVAPLLGERLDRFIFLEPFSFVPNYLRIFVAPVIGRVCYYSAFGNPFGRWVTNTAMADHRQANTDMMSSFADGRLDVPLEYLRLFDAVGAPGAFADLPGDIELVYGEHTFGAIRQSVATWAQIWPHATRHQLDGAGHLLLREAPAEVARQVFG